MNIYRLHALPGFGTHRLLLRVQEKRGWSLKKPSKAYVRMLERYSFKKKVLNGSLRKIKPICYVVVAPITLCFMIDDCKYNKNSYLNFASFSTNFIWRFHISLASPE